MKERSKIPTRILGNLEKRLLTKLKRAQSDKQQAPKSTIIPRTEGWRHRSSKKNSLRGTWRIRRITNLIKSQYQIERAAKVQLPTKNSVQ